MAKSDPAIPPTPERALHGVIERADRPVVGAPGEYEPPFVVVGVLESMLRRGAITVEQRLAGERFRAWFALARLEALKAADLLRPQVDGGAAEPEISAYAERARGEIRRAIRWLGGTRATAASCIWHVIGLDESLREWSRKRPQTTSHLNAAGILAMTLERLAEMPWIGPGEKSS